MYILIVNKKAGSGDGKKLQEALEKSNIYRDFNCRTFFTEFPGHAEKIALQVASMHKSQLKAIIVVGGDGTFHEVVNGLAPYPEIPLGLLPTGTGNDFARAIKIKGKHEQNFLRVLQSVRPVSFWTGAYSTDNRSEKHTRKFVNSIGFGFDAEIVQRTNNGWWKRNLVKMNLGFLIYVNALLRTLRSFNPYTIKITIDGNSDIHENVWMVVTSNHPYFGGGMKINPQASLLSDKLGILILKDIPKWKVLTLFAFVFPGQHTLFKEVATLQAKSVIIESEQAIPYQVDGQINTCKSCRLYKDKQERKIFTAKTR